MSTHDKERSIELHAGTPARRVHIGWCPDGDLLQRWNDGCSLGTWGEALAKSQAEGNLEHAQSAQAALDELIERGATLLRALNANAELVKLLTGQRWFVMRDAREQGATWDQIAEALGLTDAEARAYYVNAIEHQERYVGDLHDARRARAVL